MTRTFKIRNIILPLFGFSLTAVSQNVDQFALIGNKVPAVRMHLLEIPQAPKLDTVYLPMIKGDRQAFSASNKMDSKDELNAELEKMRAKYTPFMQNYAPASENTRAKLNLKKFQWRQETAADKSNFGALVNGEGNWDEVKIPHFGEP
ncbi:hypothetical protein, partial [Mariniphaga sediminis]|uniref:hypothetical protein n=1 Tax=Mariniphaga sediminis TaxID=1628158 RepID=UPI003568F92B